MNNNIQQQNHVSFQPQLPNTNQIQRSSLRDIYTGRRSRTLANGEEYSAAVLNNYSDAFLPKSHPENKHHSNVYGNGFKSIKGVFKPSNSQNPGSMTSLVSGLNSPILCAASSVHNQRQNRVNFSSFSNAGIGMNTNNSDSESYR